MSTEKNWIDAVREQCFPEEVTPSAGSWSGIGGKMRRRTLRRWGIAAAIALVPVAGALLWLPSSPKSGLVAGLERPALQSEAVLMLPDIPAPSSLRMPYRGGQAPRPSEEWTAARTDELDMIPEEQEPAAPPSTVENAPTVPAADNPAVEPFPDFPKEKTQPTARRKRLSLTLQAGSAAGRQDTYPWRPYMQQLSLQTKANVAALNAAMLENPQDILHFRHDIPLSAGVMLRWDLTSRLALESGLNYTYLHSFEPTLGHQQLHFIGIPLQLNVRLFTIGPLDLGLGGYGMVEKCVDARQGNIRFTERALQWSSGVFLDTGYRLGDCAMLYLQPSLSYYFTHTELLTYRTENRLGFTLQAGVRFHL